MKYHSTLIKQFELTGSISETTAIPQPNYNPTNYTQLRALLYFDICLFRSITSLFIIHPFLIHQFELTGSINTQQVSNYVSLCEGAVDADAVVNEVEVENGISEEQLAEAAQEAEEAANDPGTLILNGE